MRKVSEHINDARTKKAIVKKDMETGEYVVQFYVADPVHVGAWIGNHETDYFTDDKADATATAQYEINKGQ